MVGLMYGWVAPNLVKLRNDDSLRSTDAEISWIASLHEVGRICGTLFPALFLDRIGRKYTIITSSVLFLFTWTATIFAHSVPLICLLRYLLGIAQGIHDVASSIYVSENCSPHVRGIIGSVVPLCMNIGQIVEFTLATYLSYKMTNVVNTCIALSAMISCFFLKETPYFLSMKGRDGAAEKNLKWLRGESISDMDIKEELSKIQDNMQSEKLKKTSLKRLFTAPENYKSILIVVILYSLNVVTGKSVILTYASIIYQPSAIFSVSEFVIAMGVFQFFATVIAPFIIERWNRRILILSSLCIMGLCHVCTIIFFTVDPVIWSGYFPWLIFASITSYVTVYAMAFPIVFIIRSELLPMSVRAIGGAVSIVGNSLTSFIVIRLFLPITAAYGIEYNFIIYLIASILTFMFVYFIMPETRGKALIDVKL